MIALLHNLKSPVKKLISKLRKVLSRIRKGFFLRIDLKDNQKILKRLRLPFLLISQVPKGFSY